MKSDDNMVEGMVGDVYIRLPRNAESIHIARTLLSMLTSQMEKDVEEGRE